MGRKHTQIRIPVGFKYGGYTIQRKPDTGWRLSAYCTFFQSGTPPQYVTAIQGACLAPTKSDGMTVEVDVPALLALEAGAAQKLAAA